MTEREAITMTLVFCQQPIIYDNGSGFGADILCAFGVRIIDGNSIRYFNQTKYDNYLSYHKKQFADTVALCPKWTLVDFYIDEGATAPNMENAPEWSRLLCDAMAGKVDLIITQKVSNVSKKMPEVTFCSRILAKQKHPVGIYFISEDIFTLASYYTEDRKDAFFLPTPDWQLLPDSEEEIREALHDRPE